MHALYGRGAATTAADRDRGRARRGKGRHFKPKPHNQLNSNRCLAPLFGKGAESCSCCCCCKLPSPFSSLLFSSSFYSPSPLLLPKNSVHYVVKWHRHRKLQTPATSTATLTATVSALIAATTKTIITTTTTTRRTGAQPQQQQR